MLTSGYTFNNYFTSQRNWDVVCGYRLADLPARLSFLYLRCNPSTAKPVNLIALARRCTIRLLPAFILAQQLISNIVGQRRNKPLITIRIDMYFHSAAKPHLCSPAGAPLLTILNSLLFLLSLVSLVWRDLNFTCETDGSMCLSFFRFRWLWFGRRLPDHLFPATLWRDTHLFACQKVSKKPSFLIIFFNGFLLLLHIIFGMNGRFNRPEMIHLRNSARFVSFVPPPSQYGAYDTGNRSKTGLCAKRKRKLGNRLIRVMQQTATIVITGRFEIGPAYGRLLIRTNIFVTTQKQVLYRWWCNTLKRERCIAPAQVGYAPQWIF